MRKIAYLISCALLATPSSHAIVYQITRWYNPDLRQEVNILKDMHMDIDDYCATWSQLQDIIDREDVSFRIVEDMTSYLSVAREEQDPDVRESVKQSFLVERRYPEDNSFIQPIKLERYPLEYLNSRSFRPAMVAPTMRGTHLLKNTVNIEFRYPAERKLPMFKESIREMRGYHDGPVFNRYYKKIASQATATLLTDVLKGKEEEEIIADIEDIENSIINARVLHALHNNADKKIVDIIVGGWHGDTIEPIMQQSGYIKHETFGISSKSLIEGEKGMCKPQNALLIPIVDIKKALAGPLEPKKPIRARL